ncbi:MAG: 23S rRNA (pseudouridine(1915)-N(3))-methyltransferase RlmH [Pseudomonadota bacterium]
MRLRIVAVGRLGRGPESELTELYRKRLDAMARSARIGPLEIVEVEDRSGRGAEAEGALLLGAAKSERLVALDERGATLDSKGLAETLGRWRDQGAAGVAFAIGGADGHAKAVREAADLTLSFGALTWPHALARAMLAEQLYRAATILTGHPYHREG